MGSNKNPRVKFNCSYCGCEATDRPSHYTRKKRHFCSQGCYSKYREELMSPHEQPTWKGGITKQTQIGRGTKKYKHWQKSVFKRDGNKCIVCDSTENLEADHIKEWAKYPELRYELSNRRTLCRKHHSRSKKNENPELLTPNPRRLMKAKFTKYDDVIALLKSGWEIYTRRGSAPYSPLYFRVCKGDESKRVHTNTIKKLISKKVINSAGTSHDKYKFITP